MNHLLIVEDDINLGPSLKKYFEEERYAVSLAASLQEAKEALSSQPDLIVLDWMLPDGQGIDFLKDLRKENDHIPVILLTARTELIDKVIGLETGANDYVTKPFAPRELMARIRVQLRNKFHSSLLPGSGEGLQGNSDGKFDAKYDPKFDQRMDQKIIRGPLTIEFNSREVFFHGKKCDLTKMEFDLLRLLAEIPNRVFSREEILNKVWGYENYPSTRTVDTHVLQLRQKFSEDLIETIRGVGYRLKILPD